MPLSKLQFRPGIIREITEYSNSGGWYDCDKVRWRQGYPEKIGGWVAVVKQPFEGSCRFIHQWSDLENDRYVGLGTSSHLYILWSNSYYDITPLAVGTTSNPNPLTLPANPFVTEVSGTSYSLVVAATGNAANPGDYVIFSGAVGFDAYSTAFLNQQFEITEANSTTITISVPIAPLASGAQGGGSNVKATFLIPSGLDDAILGQGWGIPPWGGATVPASSVSVGWGEPFDITLLDPANLTVNQLRLWDMDNFGEDLVANIRAGPIYYWHQASGLAARALPLNQAVTVDGVTFTPDAAVPATARQILVSPNDRHLIAMGCEDVNSTATGINAEPDLLLVRWSNEEDAYTWMPLRTNSAGSQRLNSGSYIIGGMRTSQQILIWTDLSLWGMTYIGMPYVFGFQSLAEGLSIIGPNACINTGTLVYWMDRGIFYAYTGSVQELPCALKDYVFNDFNYEQGYKVYAGHNHAFSEVIWFYPSANSLENDRYVIYNYGEQLWSMGTIERTAWLDMGRTDLPIACDRANAMLYYHEFGDDDNGSPLPAYVESADIDIDGGEHYLFLRRFIGDVTFRGTAQQQSVGVTIFGRPAPGKPKVTMAQLQLTPNTGLQFMRLRERQISLRVESTDLGVSWRLGTLRSDMQPDGRR
jgi:hypothetical protein